MSWAYFKVIGDIITPFRDKGSEISFLRAYRKGFVSEVSFGIVIDTMVGIQAIMDIQTELIGYFISDVLREDNGCIF